MAVDGFKTVFIGPADQELADGGLLININGLVREGGISGVYVLRVAVVDDDGLCKIRGA